MNDRNIGIPRKTGWTDRSARELRQEDRRVLALVLLYITLMLLAIWGVRAFDREDQGHPSSLSRAGAA